MLAGLALIKDSGLSGHLGELLAGVVGWPPLSVTAVVVLVVNILGWGVIIAVSAVTLRWLV